ncbi:MAG: hypothetical protein O2U61_02035 [Candidatus Bathyarchaeota archaeon]|nr:hypothetical protein [Candidatus Bathyarchaeota archaeon]
MKLKKGTLKRLLVYFKKNSISVLDAILGHGLLVKLISKLMIPCKGVT